MVSDHSYAFSTKDHVPFKFVFETISPEDFRKYKKGKVLQGDTFIPPTTEPYRSLILPSTYFGELWEIEEEKIRKESPYSSLPSYRIRSYLVTNI
jgi:hypothetical protein